MHTQVLAHCDHLFELVLLGNGKVIHHTSAHLIKVYHTHYTCVTRVTCVPVYKIKLEWTLLLHDRLTKTTKKSSNDVLTA